MNRSEQALWGRDGPLHTFCAAHNRPQKETYLPGTDPGVTAGNEVIAGAVEAWLLEAGPPACRSCGRRMAPGETFLGEGGWDRSRPVCGHAASYACPDCPARGTGACGVCGCEEFCT